MKEPPVYAVSPASRLNGVSRDIPAPGNPVSTGSIAEHRRLPTPLARARGALGRNCGNRNFSLGLKRLRPKKRRVNTKPSRKFFVTLERLNTLEPPPIFCLRRAGYFPGGGAVGGLDGSTTVTDTPMVAVARPAGCGGTVSAAAMPAPKPSIIIAHFHMTRLSKERPERRRRSGTRTYQRSWRLPTPPPRIDRLRPSSELPWREVWPTATSAFTAPPSTLAFTSATEAVGAR